MNPDPPAPPSSAVPASRPPFRRRIILIKRTLQMKYVALVLLTVLVTGVLVTMDVSYALGRVYLKQVGEENLLPIYKGIYKMLLIHGSLYAVLVALVSVFISHKFAGPLFRLERVAETLAEGDLTVRATFRKGDELFETAASINQMIETLRQRVFRDRNLGERISEKLQEIAEKLDAGQIPPPEAAAQLRALELEVRHIASGFKI